MEMVNVYNKCAKPNSGLYSRKVLKKCKHLKFYTRVLFIEN
jgi:hypothetical protein